MSIVSQFSDSNEVRTSARSPPWAHPLTFFLYITSQNVSTFTCRIERVREKSKSTKHSIIKILHKFMLEVCGLVFFPSRFVFSRTSSSRLHDNVRCTVEFCDVWKLFCVTGIVNYDPISISSQNRVFTNEIMTVLCQLDVVAIKLSLRSFINISNTFFTATLLRCPSCHISIAVLHIKFPLIVSSSFIVRRFQECIAHIGYLIMLNKRKKQYKI